MTATADRSKQKERRAWRAWDARLASEVRRMAAELRTPAGNPGPLKGVRRQCPV